MTILIALFLSPFILLTGCLAVELFAGRLPVPQTYPLSATTGRTVILVPAHNEASILAPQLEALKHAASASQAAILVIADNCTDDTAAVARAAGVRVEVRNDPSKRGKGFALDFGRTALRESPPDVVIVIDADCKTDAESLLRLAAICQATGRPCQAINLQTASQDASPAVQISTFAFYIKNVVRQRAMLRLARRVNLLGTGMAFPWPVFSLANLATDDIVEDLRLGLELSNLGFRPLLTESAVIWSDSETQANTLIQRGRWEGGFLATSLRTGPQMLVKSLGKGDLCGVWAAIDLLIPPLTLLISLDLCLLLGSILLTSVTNAAIWPVMLFGLTLLLSVLGLILAWRAGGRRFVSANALFKAPLYILWKLPMYFAILRAKGQKDWARTRGLDH